MFIKQKKTYPMITALIMLLSIIVVLAPTIQASSPHSVKGVLYLNENEIAEPGIEIILAFPDGNETNTTYEYDLYGDNTNYNIGFFGHDDLTGSFIVIYKGHELVPEDNQTIDISPEIGHPVDLHINTTGIDAEPPSKVTGLTITDAKDGKLNLKWNPATDNIAVDYYNIYWDQNSYSSVIATVDHPTVTYQKTGLVDGTTYTFKVSAVDTSGNEGPKSDPASGTPTATSSDGDTGDGNTDGGNTGGNTGRSGTVNLPPIANAGGPYQGVINEEITFDATNSNDTDGNITGYRWDFNNDETWDTDWLTTPTTTHSYTTPGIYTIKLQVKDDKDATDTDTTTVTIVKLNNPPSKPTINGPTTGYVNTEYNFTAVSTDLDNDTIQYIFYWGDGDKTTTEFLPNGTETPLQKHIWATAGTYTISVNAYDNETYSGNNTLTFTIKELSQETPTSEEKTTEDNTILWYATGIIIIIILLVILAFLVIRRKEKKP